MSRKFLCFNLTPLKIDIYHEMVYGTKLSLYVYQKKSPYRMYTADDLMKMYLKEATLFYAKENELFHNIAVQMMKF